MTEINLRDYQVEAIDNTLNDYWNGFSKLLGVLPTGAGKTVVFTSLAQKCAGFGPTLVVAHRDELINQAVNSFRNVLGENIPIGVIKGDRNETGYPITVASVQTLARENRMEKFLQWANSIGGFFLFVIDEAHHAPATTYQYLIDEIPHKLLLGVTATPRRGDKKAMNKIFQKITFSKTLPWMIRRGYLSDMRGIAIYGGVDLSEVRTSHGDYNEKDLAEAVNVELRNEAIVEGWEKHAKGRRTLAFTVDIQHAHDLAKAWTDKGYKCEAIDGKMAMDKRRGILERFASGETQIVTNCAVLTEGFDNPAIDCIVQARPTKSDALYIQMLGRGSRIFPGKADCLVIDVVDNHGRHRSYQLPILTDGKEYDPKAIREAGGVLEGDTSLSERPVRDGVIVDERPFSLLEEDSKNLWIRGTKDTPMISIDNGKWLAIIPEITGDGTAYHLAEFNSRWDAYQKKVVTENTFFISKYDDIEDAFSEGEVWIERNKPRRDLVTKEAAWRAQPATGAQLDRLTKMRIQFDPNISKGDASKLITQRIARSTPLPRPPRSPNYGSLAPTVRLAGQNGASEW